MDTDNIKCSYSELYPLEKLIPNPRNDNQHTEKHAQLLAKVMSARGVRHPIIVSKNSGFIVAGHLRLLAAKLNNYESYPVDIQEFDNEAEEYAFLSSDNNVARYAEFDQAKFLTNLEELDYTLEELDFEDLGLLDFKLPTLDIVGETDDDAVPEVTHDPVTKRGDVWLLGDHRVMCGDSTMIDDVEKLMNGDKAAMVFTDPPYGISYQSNYRKEKFDELKNDDKILSDFIPLAAQFSTGWFIMFFGWQRIGEWIGAVECLGKMTNILIWKKHAAMGDLTGQFSPNYELAFAFNRGAKLREGTRKSAIIEQSIESAAGFEHPTTKPVKLMTDIFDGVPDGSVLDTFLGSGSTLIACEKTKRKCYGMELDEHYADIIVERWQKYTGKEATLESDGKRYNESR